MKENILVLIQLVGGNDGLNTIIPLDIYDKLYHHRKQVIIPEKKLWLSHIDYGFHPSFEGAFRAFEDNHLTIINNVGYPMQNRSHFRSMDIWNCGSPSHEQWDSGWLGRYLDLQHQAYPDTYPNEKHQDPLAISLGNIVSDTCQGSKYNYSFVVDDLSQSYTLDKCTLQYWENSKFTSLLKFVNESIDLTNHYSKRLDQAYQKGKSFNQYPENKLSKELQIITKLISGGLNTQIYTLSLSGFDTHAYQVDKNDVTKGFHAHYLQILGDAVQVFLQDLKKMNLLDRVCILTYSEFGRQIKSNSALGTDHGDAAPIFLFGNQFSNSFIGKRTQLPEEVRDQDGIQYDIDFRDVFGTLLVDWLNVSLDDVQQIFGRNTLLKNIFQKTS